MSLDEIKIVPVEERAKKLWVAYKAVRRLKQAFAKANMDSWMALLGEACELTESDNERRDYIKAQTDYLFEVARDIKHELFHQEQAVKVLRRTKQLQKLQTCGNRNEQRFFTDMIQAKYGLSYDSNVLAVPSFIRGNQFNVALPVKIEVGYSSDIDKLVFPSTSVATVVLEKLVYRQGDLWILTRVGYLKETDTVYIGERDVRPL